jgi:hypothetical protein
MALACDVHTLYAQEFAKRAHTRSDGKKGFRGDYSRLARPEEHRLERRSSVGSALTPWTVVTTASSLDKALDATAVAHARFAYTAIDKQMILEMALTSFTIYII